ncbi:Peptidase S16, Lon proteolytic domain containing protein [Candidatus Nanopelagicaceae bacterium]
MSLRFSKTPRLLTLFFALLFLVPLVTPVNFVIIQPGEGTPLFPKVLKVKSADVKTYAPHGQIYLLSIWVSTPDAKILGAEALGCWVRAECVVFPRSVIYQRNTSAVKEEKKALKEMKISQSDAMTATKKYLAQHYSSIDTSKLSDSSLKVSLPNVGGPSGGLIFTIGLIDLLTPEDILQGRKVAGSGTISANGTVGPIGGISEKIIAAKKAGATVLFASRDNCDEIARDVTGISVVAISTLDEALDYLQMAPTSNFRGVSGCTNLGA